MIYLINLIFTIILEEKIGWALRLTGVTFIKLPLLS
jgi:hypothetical protein